jgi:hypothetical protein
VIVGLLHRGALARAEAHRILNLVQEGVPYTSERRLARARQGLDRMDGILAALSADLSLARALRYEAEEGSMEGLARSAGNPSHMVARGFAADERQSAYVLANLGRVKAANNARNAHEQLMDLQRHLREIRQAIDGHRIESLTLLRMNSRIATEEYDT